MHLFTKLALLLIILSLPACRQTAEQQSEPPSETPSREASATATIPAPTPMPQAATATATQAPTDTPAVTPTAASTGTPTAWPTPASLPLPMSQESSFEIVAHEGGHVHSVAATGNIAYVGIGPRLVMLDVANPGNAQPIARSSVLPGLVHAILPGENAIYAAAGQHLVTLEMGNGELNVVAELQLPGGITYLIRVGELLYAAGFVPAGPDEHEQPTGFLAVIAPSENGDLALVDAPSLPAAVRGVAQAGDLLYLALDGKWRDNFIAFDLTSGPLLAEPATVSIPVSEEVHSLQLVGETLLIGGHMALHAVDVGASSDTDSIRGELLWQVEASPDLFLPMVEGMAVAGNTIYTVGNVPTGAYIPSRLAVPAPEPLPDSGSSPTSPLVARSDNRLFVAEGTSLEICDVSFSQPGELSSIGGYGASFPDLVSTLAIDESAAGEEILYLYSGHLNDSYPEEVFTFRLADLQPLGNLAIEIAEEAPLSQSARFDLLLHEEQAYAVAADGIHQIDVSDPAALKLVGHYPFSSNPLAPRGLVAAGDTLYLAMHRKPHIAAFTFGSGSGEQTGGLGPLEGENLQGIAATDDTLYVTTSEYPEPGWLHTIDISGDEMERLATMPLPGEPVSAMATNGGLLATAIQNQLILIDVGDPSQPEFVAGVTLPSADTDPVRYVYDLAFHDDLLFVTTSSYLLAIDVADPTSPRAISGFHPPSSGFNLGDHLVFSGDTAVVGSGPMGILVLRMSP